MQKKWRSSRFRIYCNRRSSEDRFLDSMEKTFGFCVLFYGDWSSSSQQRGSCPKLGNSKKIFQLKEVSEFRTSKMHNECLNELSKYRKKDGTLSYSRLYCPTCSTRTGSPVFVDRDFDVAWNISLAGTACILQTKSLV